MGSLIWAGATNYFLNGGTITGIQSPAIIANMFLKIIY